MRKIIISAAAAVMALSTTASALEDIKVNGQAKLWYETNNGGTNDLLNKNGASGEVVFKLGMTGKQGNVGFGTTVYQTSTMGLEGVLVSKTRTGTTHAGGALVAGGATAAVNNGSMYVGEAYFTAPLGAKTLLKFGKQELQTPLAFTEKWNAAPNTFNAAVAINSSINNVTLIGAYVGQDNATNWAVDGEVTNSYNGVFGANNATFAFGALYKNDGLAVNVWAYDLESLANALWVDAATTVAGINVKAYAAMIAPNASGADNTTAFALSGSTKVSGFTVSAAASMVSEDVSVAVANTSTGKKTKLPTAGVYTDGLFVAQNGSTAIKVKAAGKIASTGVALQAVSNTNSQDANKNAAGDNTLDATEIDLILTQKVADINFKGIVMHRDHAAWSKAQQHVRVIASVNF